MARKLLFKKPTAQAPSRGSQPRGSQPLDISVATLELIISESDDIDDSTAAGYALGYVEALGHVLQHLDLPRPLEAQIRRLQAQVAEATCAALLAGEADPDGRSWGGPEKMNSRKSNLGLDRV